MGARALVVDVVAVDGDPVARLPVAHGRAGPQDHARGVGADHVVVEGVALAPGALLAQAVEEAEGGQRLEDRGPHGVEVDGAGHHRHVGLVGGQLGDGDLADVERLARVLVRRMSSPSNIADLVAAGRRRPGRTRGAGWRPISSPDAPDWMAERNSCMGCEDSPPRHSTRARGLAGRSGRSRRLAGSAVVGRLGRGRIMGPSSWRAQWGSPPDLAARPRRSSCPDPSSSQGPAPRSASSSGALGGFAATELGRLRHRRRPSSGPASSPSRSTTSSWARCIQAGRRPDHRPPGRRQGRHPDDRAGHHRQQGVPVRAQHHLPGRPADQRRRGRHRRGRRHGVDDPGALPAPRGPGRLPASGTARWSTR